MVDHIQEHLDVLLKEENKDELLEAIRIYRFYKDKYIYDVASCPKCCEIVKDSYDDYIDKNTITYCNNCVPICNVCNNKYILINIDNIDKDKYYRCHYQCKSDIDFYDGQNFRCTHCDLNICHYCLAKPLECKSCYNSKFIFTKNKIDDLIYYKFMCTKCNNVILEYDEYII